MKKWFGIGVFGIVVILGVVALLSALAKAPSVRVAQVERGDAKETVYATGYVEARDRRILRSPRAGVIETIFDDLREGSVVRKNQKILRLRDTALDAQRRAEQAEVTRVTERLAPDSAFRKSLASNLARATTEAKDARDRADRLAKQIGSVSKDEAERAEAIAEQAESALAALTANNEQQVSDLKTALIQAKSRLDALDARQADNTIVAPIDGVILKLPLDLGEQAAAGQEVCKVGDVRELIVEAEVNEDDIALVKGGNLVLMRIAGFDDRAVEGTVFEILPDANRATKGYTIKVAFRDPTLIPSKALDARTILPGDVTPKSGMTVELGIVTRERKDVLTIPRSSVSAESTVFVVDDSGYLTETEIETGLMNFRMVEVRSGLEAGQFVAAEGLSKLSDGQRIKRKE